MRMLAPVCIVHHVKALGLIVDTPGAKSVVAVCLKSLVRSGSSSLIRIAARSAPGVGFVGVSGDQPDIPMCQYDIDHAAHHVHRHRDNPQAQQQVAYWMAQCAAQQASLKQGFPARARRPSRRRRRHLRVRALQDQLPILGPSQGQRRRSKRLCAALQVKPLFIIDAYPLQTPQMRLRMPTASDEHGTTPCPPLRISSTCLRHLPPSNRTCLDWVLAALVTLLLLRLLLWQPSLGRRCSGLSS